MNIRAFFPLFVKEAIGDRDPLLGQKIVSLYRSFLYRFG